jgi:hypothetical protein
MYRKIADTFFDKLTIFYSGFLYGFTKMLQHIFDGFFSQRLIFDRIYRIFRIKNNGVKSQLNMLRPSTRHGDVGEKLTSLKNSYE